MAPIPGAARPGVWPAKEARGVTALEMPSPQRVPFGTQKGIHPLRRTEQCLDRDV